MFVSSKLKGAIIKFISALNMFNPIFYFVYQIKVWRNVIKL